MKGMNLQIEGAHTITEKDQNSHLLYWEDNGREVYAYYLEIWIKCQK